MSSLRPAGPGYLSCATTHYDSIGLLKPAYIDRFTEYRYYDKSQIAQFRRISQLKGVGFSLTEIKAMLVAGEPAEELFSRKKQELEGQLRDLESLRQITGGIFMKTNFTPLVEDISIPFENDPRVIGKWQVETRDSHALGDKNRVMYFLPGGQSYWCFGWSRGKLIYDDGDSRFLNDYRLEERSGELYMIVSFKSQDFPRSGETTPIVLRQLDNVSYTIDRIARRDDIQKPFIPDPRIIGKWEAFCFFRSDELDKRDFVPLTSPAPDGDHYASECEMYLLSMEFLEGGHVKAQYGDELIEGDEYHTWTRGFWLRKWNSCACAYEIKEFDGREYLIIEWKSGDYRFGGRDTDYYVMVRA